MGKGKRLGFVLPAVLGILALTSLACATVWRMQWVNQQLLNVQARLVRNQQVAEGVLPLVVQDIIGTSTMTSPTSDTTTNLRHFAGTDAQTHAFYPNTVQERDKLQSRLGTAMCQAGICAPKTLANLTADQWRNLLSQSQPVNGADLPRSDISAYYWVEVWINPSASASSPANSVLPASAASGSTLQTLASQLVAPSPFIYRITVLVQEPSATWASTPSKPQPNTLVMQAIWSRATQNALSGQLHSWKLLA